MEWRRDHKRFLRESWQSMSDAAIGAHLGRTERAVAAQRMRMRILRPKDNRAAVARSSALRSEKAASRVSKLWVEGRGYLVRWREDGKVRQQDFGKWWWTRNVGEVPAGHAVCYRDGDRRNTSPGNLELRSRAEMGRKALVGARAAYRASGEHWRRKARPEGGLFDAREPAF